MSKYVKVSLGRIKELLNHEDQLLRLEGAGVDNWNEYEYSFEDYNSDISDDDVECEFKILEE